MIDKLRRILAQEDTVLFIGSGISVWSGLPSWNGLIKELAIFLESFGEDAGLVRSEAQRGELLQAASYGFDKLTKPQIGEFIRSVCHCGIAKPHDIHRKIISLGPRSFVTTNYDNLIEESLRQWLPDHYFRPPVTNRHLTEMAEVVHARANNFVFKPHGDAADSESIILTREQYRQLLPEGERHAALESLKMILATRPVVYLGFGLRDPDFLYMRDLLANTYKGGTRDHFAIMADISEAENDYWKKNYGIHLINYSTIEREDGTRDHTALLGLLDSLLEKPSAKLANAFDPRSSEVILALARYAAGLTHTPKCTPEFQIHVKVEKVNKRGDLLFKYNVFNHCIVGKLLDEGPERVLLIGLPGAGKTYSIRQSGARLAEKLHQACLSDVFNDKAIVIPMLADLKLYSGDLEELVNRTLPPSLPFNEAIKHFKVKIFLDSFNEMPREYLESGSYELDFASFMDRVDNASIVIGSRTSDGLRKLEIPAYFLDQIEEAEVTAELQRLGMKITGRFDREIIRLLQKPFYFRYILDGSVSLPREAHPRDFYRLFFDKLSLAFVSRFGCQFELKRALSLVAYDALNRGEEAFPLSELLDVLKESIESLESGAVDVNDIANWLVSVSVMIPYIGGRVGFVHQSVTEYLASAELVRLYMAEPHILKEKLRLTRWDQALFLALSLLPATQAEQFFRDVTEADLVLACRASKYIETGRNEVVTKLLAEISREAQRLTRDLGWELESAIKYELPLVDIHEPLLRELITHRNSLGAAAVKRLVELKGIEVKDELLELLVEYPNDYNFCCNGIGSALQKYATTSDVPKIAAFTTSIQSSYSEDNIEKAVGFISGSAIFLSALAVSDVWNGLFPADKSAQVPLVLGKLLCEILQNHHSSLALNFAGELLLRGVDEAATTAYFIAEFANDGSDLLWDEWSTRHADRLMYLIDSQEDRNCWPLNALAWLCFARPDLADYVNRIAETKTGFERGILLYCASPDNLSPVFEAMADLVADGKAPVKSKIATLLGQIDFNWTGREELFGQLLRLRDKALALAIMGNSIPPTTENLGPIDIGEIDWWMRWMLDEESTDDGRWFANALGAFLGSQTNKEKQNEFLAEFNRPDSLFRHVLLDMVLPYCNEINIDEFSDDAISFMLADLSQREKIISYKANLLGLIATEKFVTERLLPLLSEAKEPLLGNLQTVLKEAGARHGKRYLLVKE